jgi:hypothetical protein
MLLPLKPALDRSIMDSTAERPAPPAPNNRDN